jgi:hypothetical protein
MMALGMVEFPILDGEAKRCLVALVLHKLERLPFRVFGQMDSTCLALTRRLS